LRAAVDCTVRGLAALASGDVAPARDRLKDAERRWSDLGFVTEAASVKRDLAKVAGCASDVEV
jgi:hypothetical protein